MTNFPALPCSLSGDRDSDSAMTPQLLHRPLINTAHCADDYFGPTSSTIATRSAT